MTREWFWLYRPRAASHRAQAVQVVNSAHALAARGHRVTLCVQGEADSLAFCGLSPSPTLSIHTLPARDAVASWAYWGVFARWLRRTRGSGVVLARRKRHAARALQVARARFRLLVEAHEVDSAQAAEAGRAAHPAFALEQRVLGGAWGVIANCEGTLRTLRAAHRIVPPARVIHNGTSASWPAVPARRSGIGYVGSLRASKDVRTLARAAAMVHEPIVLVGPPPADVARLQPLAEGRLRWEPAVPYGEVPARLVRFRALVVTEGAGLFGSHLTSPLKLWDALASGVPVVAADTPAVRAVAGAHFIPYLPGDLQSLVGALTRALESPRPKPRIRTWATRAAELEAFADAVFD